jgi:molybdenum cofactor guanylyltransferase
MQRFFKMKLRASLPFNCEVCILAGGLSTRMQRDKSRLRLDHRTMLGCVRAAARRLKLPVRVIQRDLKPGCGPLGGIYTALKSSHTDIVLFLACDMPFVSTGLLQKALGNLTPGHRALFVRHGGRVGFPFLLRRDVLPVVIDQVVQKELSLQTLATILKARTIRLPHAMSAELFNINTPADWKKARKRVAGSAF